MCYTQLGTKGWKEDTSGDEITNNVVDIHLERNHPWLLENEYHVADIHSEQYDVPTLDMPSEDEYIVDVHLHPNDPEALGVPLDWMRRYFFRETPEDFEPRLLEQLAGLALRDYNKNQGVERKLLGEVTASITSTLDKKHCYYLRFQAHQDNEESSPMHFFARVLRFEDKEPIATFCEIIYPSDPNWRATDKHYPKDPFEVIGECATSN